MVLTLSLSALPTVMRVWLTAPQPDAHRFLVSVGQSATRDVLVPLARLETMSAEALTAPDAVLVRSPLAGRAGGSAGLTKR